jgi:RNA polymerase sigma-70 factor (TIGR02943 family)
MSELNPENWLKNYGDLLFQYTLPRVNDISLAEDLVQETFLAAYKNRLNYKGVATEKNWLFAILKHKIVDYYRSKRSNISVIEEDGPDEEWFSEEGAWKRESIPGSWNTAAINMENKDLLRVLNHCKGNLKKLQQEVYILKYLEEMDANEICKVLGINPTNYWILLHRARLQMRSCIEKHWFNK